MHSPESKAKPYVLEAANILGAEKLSRAKAGEYTGEKAKQSQEMKLFFPEFS